MHTPIRISSGARSNLCAPKCDFQSGSTVAVIPVFVFAFAFAM